MPPGMQRLQAAHVSEPVLDRELIIRDCRAQALKDAQARYDADPSCGAPPIMWDEAEQKYFGLH